MKLTVASQCFLLFFFFRQCQALQVIINKGGKKQTLEEKSGSSVSFAVAQVDERKAFDECEIWIFFPPSLLKTIVLKLFCYSVTHYREKKASATLTVPSAGLEADTCRF